MSIKYINNNDKVIDNPYLAELDNVIHPVGIVMPWIKHIVPEEVCKGMVDMLDSTGWFIKNIDKSPQEYIDSHRVLDICCRSGNFLRAFYERFNVYLSYKIKNQDKRDYFIWRYLLFGFAGQIREELSKGLTADQENKVADAAIKELRKELYSGFCFYEEDFHGNIYDIQFRPYLDGNNLVWTGKDCPGYTTTFENRAFGKELNEMKFNAIIGNPPYNNDAYIDFVTKGHAIATDYSLWITPAKWQAKSGQKNEAFRQNIVPHMKKIVYYPVSTDIFDIGESAGISYYITDKSVHTNKELKILCVGQEQFSTDDKYISSDVKALVNSKIRAIIDKCSTMNNVLGNKLNLHQSYYVKNTDSGHDMIHRDDIEVWGGKAGGEKDITGKQFFLLGYKSKDELLRLDGVDKYKACLSCMPTGNNKYGAFDENGMAFGLKETLMLKPNQVPKGSYFPLMCFDTENEVKSFISYFNTRFIRFLIICSIVGTTISSELFRFVPDPGDFDHIFTDEELYKKYNLTDEEINIIESVIKERK